MRFGENEKHFYGYLALLNVKLPHVDGSRFSACHQHTFEHTRAMCSCVDPSVRTSRDVILEKYIRSKR